MNRALFSPDGRRLVVSSGDGFVHVWTLPRDPRPIEDLLSLAELLASQKIDEIGGLMPLKREDLRAAWESLRAKYPNDFTTSSEQRRVWQQRKDAEQADRSAKKHYNAGRTHLQLRQWNEAMVQFDEAVQLKSDDPMMFNNIAWEYVTTEGFPSPEKALPLALKAVELSKARHDELNTLGIVYYRLGELEKARVALERSVHANISGGSAHDFFFLAMTYERLGDSLKAAENFAKGEKWLESQSDLYSLSRVELEQFRAEAEAVLGKTK